jgi:transposase
VVDEAGGLFKGTRREFSRKFKVEAVKLVTERGVRVSQAARDLDVGETVLRSVMCSPQR